MQTTKHTCTSHGGALPFGRKAPEGQCPRCDELRNGASPRTHAGFEALSRRQRHEQEDAAALRAHFAPGGPHRAGKCGPVCTAFDW